MAAGITVAVRGLGKSFDGGLVEALRGVDLEIGAGERVAVMGPTGCGKSTLVSLLALLDVPDAGTILLDGHSPRELAPEEDWRRRELGIVFQLHHLLPHLTTRENVLLPVVGRQGLPAARDRADALLARLGLSHRAGTLAARLSGGERQLAALARALVNEPRLLLADEPTGSVDSATGQRILDTLLDWCHEHPVTVVVVTHDSSVAARLDRTILMRDGVVASQRGAEAMG